MSRRLRILVVDDSVDLRETVCATLEDAGYEAAGVESADDALRAFAAGAVPDLVLLDVLMPGMDGAQLLARLREEGRLGRARVVVMTGIASGLVAKLVEADAFLFKPFSGRELLDVVAGVLARGER